MDLNRLSINMITTQESILLDLIDLIEDKNQQRKIIEKVLEANKQKKLKPKIEVVVNPAYNMIEVLSRMKKEKSFSIQDLRTKINALKIEIVQLKRE